MAPETLRATDSTYDRSASPFSVGGVPTAMNTAALARTAACKSPEKIRRWPRCRASSSGRNFSWMGTLPRCSAASFSLIVVDQDDVVSQFGKARSRHQANVTRAHNRNMHPPPRCENAKSEAPIRSLMYQFFRPEREVDFALRCWCLQVLRGDDLPMFIGHMRVCERSHPRAPLGGRIRMERGALCQSS